MSRLVALVFDANDPSRLAHFWAAALGWDIDDETGDEIDLVPTDGTPFGVRFDRAQDRKENQNRVHLDLTTASIDDQNVLVARLIELGASHIDIGQSPDELHVVLADPEGNEFCVIEPGNNPLMPKPTKDRLHFDIAPLRDVDQDAEVSRLVSLGAAPIDIGQGDVDWVVMADPDGNEFCVLSPR